MTSEPGMGESSASQQDKCVDCPVINDYLRQIEARKAANIRTIELYDIGELESLAARFARRAVHPSADLPVKGITSQELTRAVLAYEGMMMENLHDEIVERENEIMAHKLACAGILKMRASRSDMQFVVTVCGSPIRAVSFNEGDEPSTVRRTHQ